MSALPLEIFRTYDIRGIYPDQLNKENIYYIGRALGTYFNQKNIFNIVMGMDNRNSSPPLFESMKNGLLESGTNVRSAGITIQPAAHFFSFLDGVDAVVNITASHNPKQYNGLKVDYKNAWPFQEREYKVLYELATREDFVSGKGTFAEEDLNSKYIEHFAASFNFKKKFNIVLDCGNAAISEMGPKLLRRLGINLITENCSFDGSFPFGVPDPENDNFLNRLSEEVKRHNADLGLGFDGDGDRFGVIDRDGKHYHSDRLLLLFSKYILEKNLGAKIVFDVKSSYMVDKVIRKFGGVPEMMRTGRTFFLPKTLQKEAVLGGEFSGHFFFSDKYYGFDDGIYAACRLLEILDKTGKNLSELMGEFEETVSTPEYQIPCPDEFKYDVVNKIKSEIESGGQFQDIVELDGIRVITSDTSWFLIRPKNTSPYLTLRAEADTNEKLLEQVDMAVKYLSKHEELDLSVI
jgi:phosphomannomutase/phosphoglucomutase